MSRLFLPFGVAALLAAVAICQAYEPPSRNARPTATPPGPCGDPAIGPSCRDQKPDAASTPRCASTTASTPSGNATRATPADAAYPTCYPVGTTPAAPACRVTTTATGSCFSGPATGTVTLAPSQVCPAQAAPAIGYMTWTVAGPAQKPTIDSVLAKLEALKARREAIEREEREGQAVLKGLLDELQKRVNKVGLGAPTPVPPAPAYAPTPVTGQHSPMVPSDPLVQAREVCYYEPVTTYETVAVFDKEAGTYRKALRAVTKYVLRKANVPAVTPPQCPDAAPTPPPVVDQCPAPRPSEKPRAVTPVPPTSY